jgi:P4 family phage/plasmid primase-like protien
VRTSAGAADGKSFCAETRLWRPCSPQRLQTIIGQVLQPVVAAALARARAALPFEGRTDNAAASALAGDSMEEAGDAESTYSAQSQQRMNQSAASRRAQAEVKYLLALSSKVTNTNGLRGIRDPVSAACECPDFEASLNCSDDGKHVLPVCGGNILSLRSGETRRRTADDLWTFELPWTYRPASELPRARAKEHMLQLMNGNEEMMPYFQQLLGYCLTGVTTEKTLWIFQGGTDTGKSKLVELLGQILGQMCTQAADKVWLAQSLEAGGGGGATPELAALLGARLAVKNETAKAGALDSVRVKSLTGGDTITYRKLYSAQATFKPQFKCVISTNHKPTFDATEDAMHDRIALIEFKHKYGRAAEDVAYVDDVMANRIEEFASWMVDGAIAFFAAGGVLPQQPDCMREAVAAYARDNNPINLFAEEAIEIGADDESAKVIDVWEAYKRYARGKQPGIARKAFVEAISTRYDKYTVKGTGSTMFWKGLRLRHPPAR